MAAKSIPRVFSVRKSITHNYWYSHHFQNPMRLSPTLLHFGELQQRTSNLSFQCVSKHFSTRQQILLPLAPNTSSHIRKPWSLLLNSPKLIRAISDSSKLYHRAAERSVVDVEHLLGNIDHIDYIDKLFQDLIDGTRMALARAITLVEASHPGKQRQAQYLLTKVLEYNQAIERHNFKGPRTFRIGTYLFTSKA